MPLEALKGCHDQSRSISFSMSFTLSSNCNNIPQASMPPRLLKNRFVFFVYIAFLQVAIHVCIGLLMYAVYNTAKRILLEVFKLVPSCLIANLWQVGVVFLILS